LVQLRFAADCRVLAQLLWRSFEPHLCWAIFAAAPPRFILEIDIGKLLHVVVAHNKAGFLFLDGPGRREAALIAASDGK
jgi:hypothetical protein